MARSTYVYYFQSRINSVVLAAFTVKYEAIAYAQKENLSNEYYGFYRVRDGGHGEPEEMEWTNQLA